MEPRPYEKKKHNCVQGRSWTAGNGVDRRAGAETRLYLYKNTLRRTGVYVLCDTLLTTSPYNAII